MKTKTATKAKGQKPTPRPKNEKAPSPETSDRFKALVAGTAKEPAVGDAPAPESTATETLAPAPAPEKPPRERRPKASPKPRRAVEPDVPLGPTSLKTIGGAYIAHLQEVGKSLSTVASYAADLGCAYEFFGPARAAETIIPAQVAQFDESDLVTRKKSGAARAKPTILKTRRVLRLALVWAAEAGLVDQIPYPAKAPAA